MSRFLAFALLALASCGQQSEPQPAPEQSAKPEFGFTGAFDSDCSHSGRNANGVEVFITSCFRTAVSPDKRWQLVNAGEGSKDRADSDYVFIETGAGERVGPVPGLSDGMPFAMIWSPRPDWFFVEHHVGSFMQVPEVFEITSNRVVKHDEFRLAGQNAARERFPCLPEFDVPWVSGNVMGWSKDGGRLAWVLRTRIDVCMEPGQTGSVRDDQVVNPILMISDIDSGQVIDGSVIVIGDDEGEFDLPSDGPYRDIVRPSEPSTGGD